MKQTIFIVDAYNLIYRMFYAVPEMHTRDGQQVNVIFGVAKFLKGLAEENPTAQLVIASDVGKSFRADMYAEYKATRDRMPDNLRTQIAGVFELFDAAKISVLSKEGYEADDIIGSLAISCHSESRQVVIISSDKDLCQFVQDGCVHIYDAMKRRFLRRRDVIEKFGVPPEQVRDYLAIVGDTSDNIPGIAGFGPKKAVDLLQTYGSLHGLYQSMGITYDEKGNVIQKDEAMFHNHVLSIKMKTVLVDQIKNAILSQQLATIITDVPVVLQDLQPFTVGLGQEEYISLLQKYEFRSLLPAGVSKNKAPSIVVKVQEVATISTFNNLQKKLQQSKKVVIWIEGLFCFLGIAENIYQINTKHVDIVPIVKILLGGSVELIGYDLKDVYRQLYFWEKPFAATHDQSALF